MAKRTYKASEYTSKNIREGKLDFFPGSRTFDCYEDFEADVEYWYDQYGQESNAGLNPGDIIEYIAGNIERDGHPTDNPMQFTSLMRCVRAALPRIDKTWSVNPYDTGKAETSLKESETSSYREDDFDFTIHDPNEDVFDNLVADFNAMRMDQEELDTLGLDIKNSLNGLYGIYLSGNGKPDVVVNDFEVPLRTKPYRYKISIYQIQEKGEKLYDEIYDYLSQKIEPIQESKLSEAKKSPNSELMKYQDEDCAPISYACYTLDEDGNEFDSFAYEYTYRDAVEACKEKSEELGKATHAVILYDQKDDETEEGWDFLDRVGCEPYEVVYEYFPESKDSIQESKTSKLSEAEEHKDYWLGEYPDEYYDSIEYRCSVLDEHGHETECFAYEGTYGDAVESCKAKSKETGMATHAVLIHNPEDSYDESWDFLDRVEAGNRKVVYTYSPKLRESMVKDSIDKATEDIKEYLLMCNDSEAYQEAKTRKTKQRIKEDSWDDPFNTTWYRDAQKKQSNEPKYTPEQMTVAKNYWEGIFWLVQEGLDEVLGDLGFDRTDKFNPYRAYEYSVFAGSGPKHNNKFMALPGGSIYVRVNIGNYGIKNKDGEKFDCSDLAEKVAKKINDLGIIPDDVNIKVSRAEPRNQFHEYYEWEFKIKFPEDLFTDSYYMTNYLY